MRVITAQNPSGTVIGAAGSTIAGSSSDHSGATSSARKERAKTRKPISDAEMAVFFANTATLLNSGVPLIKSLEALAMDESLAKAAPTLEAMVRDMRSGSSFSACLSKHPEVFSPMVVSLVRAGEASSKLTNALDGLAEGLEKRRETIAQIRQAFTYPGIVTVLGSAAICFLMIFVVPVFEETYTKAGMPLPSITRALIAMSNFVAKTWLIGILGAVTSAIMYWKYRSHPKVRSIQDRLLLRLPVLGPVIQGVMVGRFVRCFGSLLSGGLSIKESLALTEQVVKHSEFVDMVRELRLAVARGEGIGAKLSEYRELVPPLLTRMIVLGEKSGDLGNMIQQVGKYTEKELTRRMQRMNTFIEPLITIAMAAAIGTIAMAIYLPIFDMFKHIK